MKTTILASTLLLGFAFAATPSTAGNITVEAISIAELSFDTSTQVEQSELLHTVKGRKGKRRRNNRRNRSRDNLASDGNIGNGTLRARIEYEENRYSNRYSSSRNSTFRPFGFFRRAFGN